MSSPAAIPTSTTTTQNQNTVPEFLQPNVQTLLGAASQQVYNMDAAGGVHGIKAYTPYSTSGADYVAPMTDLQKEAQTSAAGLQMPGQIQQATGIATAGAQQSMGAGAQYNAQATDPNSIAAYMSPYMQNVVAQQQREANRTYDVSATKQQGAATQQGAFGGSREAIMAAENERNRNIELARIQAEGTQQAFTQAQQAQQFGTTAGLQGAGQGISAAGLIGDLGKTQLASQQSIITTQAQQGAIQQAQQQAAIDAAVANQQRAQAYPIEQMSAMSAMIRGTPVVQSGSTQTNAAVPANVTSQIMGGIGTAASLYGASQAGKAKGGIIELDKTQYYDVGGSVEADLYDMTPQQLQTVIQEATSETERSMAKRILAEKSMARGGIVAFADAGEVKKRKPYKAPPTKNKIFNAEESAALSPDFLSNTPVQTGIAPPAAPVEAAPVTPPPAAPVEAPAPVSTGIAEVAPKKVEVKNPIKKHQFFNDLEDKNGLPSSTLSIIHQLESNSGKNLNTSKRGAKGHFQFMPDTAEQYGVKDPNDLKQSATGAAKYLGELTARYGGDVSKGAAAYNWGPANMDHWVKTGTGIHGQPMPKETIDYMNTVQAKLGLPETGIAAITKPAGEPAPDEQPAAPAGPSAQDQGIAMLQGQQEKAQVEADKPMSEYLAEGEAAREKAGIGTNEATQQYRADVMAERANAPAEKERQAYLRAAEFFAHWGSTPGPVLAAGLKSLNETMPGYLEDAKDQQKLRLALGRSLFEVNQAARLEEQGYFKEAAALKEKASETAMKYGNLVAQATIAKGAEQEKLASQERVAAEGNVSRVEAAGLRSQGTGSGDTHLRQTLALQMKGVNSDIKDTFKRGKPPKEGSPNYDKYSKLVAKRDKITGRIDSLGNSPASENIEPTASEAGGLTIGQVVDGHTYQGGDPNDEANWIEE